MKKQIFKGLSVLAVNATAQTMYRRRSESMHLET